MWTFFIWALMTAHHAFRAVPAPTPAMHHRVRRHATDAGAPVTYEKSEANDWLMLVRAPSHYGQGARSDAAYHGLEEQPTSPREARMMERGEQRGAE